MDAKLSTYSLAMSSYPNSQPSLPLSSLAPPDVTFADRTAALSNLRYASVTALTAPRSSKNARIQVTGRGGEGEGEGALRVHEMR